MLESLTESLTESLRESLGSGDDIKSTNLPSNFFFELDFIRETNTLLPMYKNSTTSQNVIKFYRYIDIDRYRYTQRSKTTKITPSTDICK